ncbi:hypothetical protein E5161_13860 [Cohnella pontilimi]|uniref:Uncharacterized protein n=1 Tax=Cohnella pontilimi TaxID=2564100 RepID=A0A4U0F9N8_9BACL|nr:hypothetical protein [Cohnella pontilimi]TJY41483.1 hypothetical protein E5161_13860 [Cohnella pontilimi]
MTSIMSPIRFESSSSRAICSFTRFMPSIEEWTALPPSCATPVVDAASSAACSAAARHRLDRGRQLAEHLGHCLCGVRLAVLPLAISSVLAEICWAAAATPSADWRMPQTVPRKLPIMPFTAAARRPTSSLASISEVSRRSAPNGCRSSNQARSS